jgi:putative transposase
MPNCVRWPEEGATYFFTVVAYRRQRILTKTLFRGRLRAAFAAVRERLSFETPAIVLLPDHLHCIWTLPPSDDDFPQRWRQIKGRFTHDYLASGGRDWDVTDQHAHQRRRGGR